MNLVHDFGSSINSFFKNIPVPTFVSDSYKWLKDGWSKLTTKVNDAFHKVYNHFSSETVALQSQMRELSEKLQAKDVEVIKLRQDVNALNEKIEQVEAAVNGILGELNQFEEEVEDAEAAESAAAVAAVSAQIAADAAEGAALVATEAAAAAAATTEEDVRTESEDEGDDTAATTPVPVATTVDAEELPVSEK